MKKIKFFLKTNPLAVFNSCFNKKCINTGKKTTLIKPFHGLDLSFYNFIQFAQVCFLFYADF